jgi:uncharacterized protein DUF6798
MSGERSLLRPSFLEGGFAFSGSAFSYILSASVGLLVLKFAFHDNMTSNELDTLMVARRWADPSFLPGDWYTSLHPGPRAPFDILLWPLVRSLPLVDVSIVGRVIVLLALAIPLSRLAQRLDLSPSGTVVVGGLYIALGQSIVGGEWLFGLVESKVLSYALVAYGLDQLLFDRLRRGALAFGAATTLHVLVGGWASLAAVFTVLWTRVGTARERLYALALWVTAAAPGLTLAAMAALPFHPTDGPPASDIYVHFRVPHHTDPRSWVCPWSTWLLGFTMLAVLIWAACTSSWRSPEGRIARFSLATLVPFALGLAVAGRPTGNLILQLYPFRVGSAIALLSGIAFLARALLGRCPRPLAAWISRAAALTIAVMAVQAFTYDVALFRLFPDGGRPVQEPLERARALVEACTFIRQHTPAGTLVLASPAADSVSYLTGRPVVVSFKAVPSATHDLHEWYRRISDLNGGSFRHTGFEALQEIAERFPALSRGQYLALAQKYNASVLLVRRRNDLELPLLYENEDWSVFDVRPARSSLRGFRERTDTSTETLSAFCRARPAAGSGQSSTLRSPPRSASMSSRKRRRSMDATLS